MVLCARAGKGGFDGGFAGKGEIAGKGKGKGDEPIMGGKGDAMVRGLVD